MEVVIRDKSDAVVPELLLQHSLHLVSDVDTKLIEEGNCWLRGQDIVDIEEI